MANFSPKHHTATGLSASVAKILFLIIGVASTAVLISRFDFPYFLDLLSPSLQNLRDSVISFLAPPYLFVAVNFIIMIIWSLSYNNNPRPVDTDESTKSSSYAEDPRESEPEITEYHTTMVSANDKKSTKQKPRPPPEPEPEDPEEIKEIEYYPDSIDATWKAIMEGRSSPFNNNQLIKKSDTWEKTVRVQADSVPTVLKRAVAVDGRKFVKSDTFKEKATTATTEAAKKEMRKSTTFREPKAAARDVLVGGHDHHELLRYKFEAFIKKNYDQMRLQRKESEQRRRVEMQLNAAY